MNAMNGVLHSPKELMPFCQTSATKKRLKLSKLRDRSDSTVKQESTDDFKDYAETTMNELLGWYGYEKLDTRDTKDLNLGHFTANDKRSDSQQRMASKTSRSCSSSASSNKSKESLINREDRRSTLSPFSGSDGGGGGGVGTTTADRTDVCRSASPTKITTNTESNSDNGMENKDCCEDNQNIPPGCIVCAWCAKVGMKLFTLRTANGCKAFCSDLCFTQCRRASFKKNKICDWCKHVRHTVNYVDFQDGEQQLQFCSNKCLNQYKMNIFCNETKAHLHLNPNLIKDNSKLSSLSKASNLITPELWLKDPKIGENEYNSVSSLKDSSDSELDLELEDSPQPMVSHPNKRKFSEFSKDVNQFKPNERQKDIPIKLKANKESKRVKHSNRLSNISSRQTSDNKHSKQLTPELIEQREWSSRDSSEKTHSYHSSSHRPHARHSPTPPTMPSMRPTVVAPSNNIPLLNGHSNISQGIRHSPPHNHMTPNAPSPGQLFPRLPGSLVRGAPHMPSQHFGPRLPAMPNLFGAAQMEMFARMQSSFGLRPPLPPFGPPHTGYPFAGLPHMNGVHPNVSPLIQPPIQPTGPHPTQFYPNFSLLPPMTVMAPYPVPIPIPIPIPVPILFPVDKELYYKNNSAKNSMNNNPNISSTNDVTTSSYNTTPNTCATTASKVESVISKLVERKTKANSSQNYHSIDHKLDLRRLASDDNVNDMNSDNSSESLPQNLVVNRDKKYVDMASGSGYGVP